MSYGKHAKTKQSFVSRVISTVLFVAFVLALTWGLQTFVARPYTIPSGSMENTIAIGDNVWAEKLSYYFHQPHYKDIVVFDDPEIPGRTLIKRVIATGGQTVNLVDGHVVVDGQTLDEPYTDGRPSDPLQPAYGVSISYPYTVPEGYLWVMGDNRTNSADSRYFGAIKATTVHGRAFFKYWPINQIGVL